MNHNQDTSDDIELKEDHSFTFGPSEPELKALKAILAAKDPKILESFLEPIHFVDIAELLGGLDSEELYAFVQIQDGRIDSELLAELSDDVRSEILPLLTNEEIAAAIEDLQSDDALNLMEELDEEQQQEVLDTISAENREELETLLSYPEGSAGRLMQKEFASVPKSWTVERVREYLRNIDEPLENFYEIYCVDRGNKILGAVPLATLLQSTDAAKVQDIIEPIPHILPVLMAEHDVAHVFRHYHLVSAPVVDDKDRLIGMVTIDDVVEVMDEEAETEILHMARLGESDFHESVITTALTRILWLIVPLLNTLLCSFVIAQFQMSIEKKVSLAVLMPIVAAMGGNSGMQVVTVTVRALATGELRSFNSVKQIFKEVQVGLINGIFFAGVMGTTAALWFHDNSLGLVLGAAMIFNVVWAGFSGTFLPILVHSMGKDPALSAGPAVTSSTDVLGFAVFLGLATFFLL